MKNNYGNGPSLRSGFKTERLPKKGSRSLPKLVVERVEPEIFEEAKTFRETIENNHNKKKASKLPLTCKDVLMKGSIREVFPQINDHLNEKKYPIKPIKPLSKELTSEEAMGQFQKSLLDNCESIRQAKKTFVSASKATMDETNSKRNKDLFDELSRRRVCLGSKYKFEHPDIVYIRIKEDLAQKLGRVFKKKVEQKLQEKFRVARMQRESMEHINEREYLLTDLERIMRDKQ